MAIAVPSLMHCMIRWRTTVDDRRRVVDVDRSPMVLSGQVEHLAEVQVLLRSRSLPRTAAAIASWIRS